jgi:hypothetical protein
MKAPKHLSILLKKVLPVIFILLVTYSCVKEYLDMDKFSNEIEYKGGFAGPVAFGKFTALDLIRKFDKKNMLLVDNEDVIYLRFEQPISSKRADEIITLPDIKGFDTTITSVGFPGAAPFTINKFHQANMDFGKNRIIDSIVFDGGNLNITVNSTIATSGTITFSFPRIRNSIGQPIQTTFNLNSGSNETKSISLANHSLGLYHPPTEQDSNYFVTNFIVTFNSAPGAGNLSLSVNFSALDYKSMYGYFDKDTFMNEDSVNLDINILEGTEDFKFAAPRLTLLVKNSVGIPLQVKLENMFAKNNETNTIQPISFVGNGIFDIPYPTITANQIREYDTVFSEANLIGYKDAMNIDPDYVRYRAYSSTNATTIGKPKDQFITDTSKFDLMLGVELPMYGYTNNYMLNDTQKLDLGNLSGEASSIDYLLVQFRLVNNLPAVVKAQVYFVDSTYKLVDSLFTSNNLHLVDSPPIDNTGRTIGTKESTSKIEKNNKGLTGYENVRFAIVKIIVNTPDASTGKLVKILSTNFIETYISVDVDFRVNSRRF